MHLRVLPDPSACTSGRCEVYPASATTDAQRAVIAPLLPPPGSAGGRGDRPGEHDRRLITDAIFYLVHGGIAWREPPRECPPRSTVCSMFTRWIRCGAWKGVHDALVELLRVRDGRRHRGRGHPRLRRGQRDGGLCLVDRLVQRARTITMIWADAGYAARLVVFVARVNRPGLATRNDLRLQR